MIMARKHCFPVAQVVRNLPVMQETRVQSLGREDPLEKGMSVHSSILAWRIPRTEKPGSSILAWRIPWTGMPGRHKESDTTE